MAYGRNYGGRAVKNSSGHPFLIKSPEILDGASAPSYDQNVQPQLIQGLNPLCNAVLGLFSLYKRRIENQLDIGIASGCNVHDITDSSPCAGSDDADPSGISGNGTLIAGIKHPHFLQLISQRFKPCKEISPAFSGNLLCIKLIAAIPLIYVYRALYHYLLTFFQTETQAVSLSSKHDGGNLCAAVL